MGVSDQIWKIPDFFLIEPFLNRDNSFKVKNKKTKRVVDLSELASTYHSIMIGSLGLFLSAPVRVLVIGLGGGSLPIYIHSKFPLSNVHVVEIDPAIVRSVKIIWGHFLMKVLLKLV